ncbi:MAG: CDP-glucose 4,6-dehydratase, partial [Pseudomonadota bacterium]
SKLMELWKSTLENLVMPTSDFWKNKRVFLTGHTGFKGSWLSLILSELGAQVCGFSLPPENDIYHQLQVPKKVESHHGDLRDVPHLERLINEFKPEVLFHLAAQALVRKSYDFPRDTWSVNLMGTINLLDSISKVDSLKSVVIVTTDKVYRNTNDGIPFKENDPLEGADPYSASKAAADIASFSYAKSFYNKRNGSLRLATARAGNVIGGGDWAEDRLIPDIFRSIKLGKELDIRNPHATRPWQHVLDVCNGYLSLAQYCYSLSSEETPRAFNFGPSLSHSWSVQQILEFMKKNLDTPFNWRCIENNVDKPEAQKLFLDAQKANHQLQWSPKLDIHQALLWTIDWYQSWLDGGHLEAVTVEQIKKYGKMP